jgi:hypothetical protein
VPESGLVKVSDALAATSTLENADPEPSGGSFPSPDPDFEQPLALARSKAK